MTAAAIRLHNDSTELTCLTTCNIDRVVEGSFQRRGPRTARGFVFGTATAVMGAVYQVNLLTAGLVQANANVPGVKAFPLEGIVLGTGFVGATLVLLLHRERT